MRVNPGDRVQVTGLMPDEPDPIPVGSTGTVVRVNRAAGEVHVDWDAVNPVTGEQLTATGSKRQLMLLLDVDPFLVLTAYAIGDRVKVVQLIKDEPCSDVDVLIGQIGTVTDPAVEDDRDGETLTVVRVLLDHEVDMGGWPPEFGRIFVFEPDEIERLA